MWPYCGHFQHPWTILAVGSDYGELVSYGVWQLLMNHQDCRVVSSFKLIRSQDATIIRRQSEGFVPLFNY